MASRFEWLLGYLFEYVDALARVLVTALLNSLWQGVLLVALVWLLLRLSRRASATTRHAVWLVSLLALVLLPVFTGTRAWRKSRSIVAPMPLAQVKPAPVKSPVKPPVKSMITTSLPLIAYQTSVPQVTQQVTQTASLCCLQTASSGVTLSSTTSAAAILPSDFKPVPTATSWKSAWLAGRLPLVLAVLWCLGCALMLARFVGSYLALRCLRRGLTDVPVEITA